MGTQRLPAHRTGSFDCRCTLPTDIGADAAEARPDVVLAVRIPKNQAAQRHQAKIS